MSTAARYDGFAAWYQDFRPGLADHEVKLLRRLLGRGPGRCLDVGCGTGVAFDVLAELGWSVVGVDLSLDLLEVARQRSADVVHADAASLPFEDGSFEAAVSVWTHTDVDDFTAVVREIARVVRRGAPFVYVGAHPCFIGPHSRFFSADGVPTLHSGYRRTERYSEGPAIRPEGLRARVGAVHLPLGRFLGAFVDAGFTLERFEEDELRDYPYTVALRCRR